MKKFISILAIAAVAALAFVSCKKDNDNVKGTYTLDYDITEDHNLGDKDLDKLDDYLEDMIEGAKYEDVTLKEVVEEVNAMIKKDGPGLAAKFPDKYFTVMFEIYNDKEECVKTILAPCKDGNLFF